MTRFLTDAFIVFLWLVLAWLAVYEWRHTAGRRRRELRRLPRIDVDPPRINQVRRDPSPTPRRKAG